MVLTWALDSYSAVQEIPYFVARRFPTAVGLCLETVQFSSHLRIIFVLILFFHMHLRLPLVLFSYEVFKPPLLLYFLVSPVRTTCSTHPWRLYLIGQMGPDSRQGYGYFSSPPCPNRLWGPSSLLSNGYRGCFPGGKAAGTRS